MKGLLATVHAALREAVSDRRSFALQVLVMVINDLAWIAFWSVLFRRVRTIGSWDFQHVIWLQAALTTSGGIVLGLFADARTIGRLALDGRLDAVLTLPAPVLPHLLVRRIEPTNFGDSIFGIGLFLVASHVTPIRLVTFVVCVALSVTLLTSFLVVVGSTAFWSKRPDGGELGFNAILVLANWPIGSFGPTAKLLLSTAVPALFIATVPAELIGRFSSSRAAALVAVTAAFVLLAQWTFGRALRSYTSGSAWTRA